MVGTRQDDDQMNFNPDPSTQIFEGDILILLDETAAIKRPEKLAISKGEG